MFQNNIIFQNQLLLNNKNIPFKIEYNTQFFDERYRGIKGYLFDT